MRGVYARCAPRSDPGCFGVVDLGLFIYIVGIRHVVDLSFVVVVGVSTKEIFLTPHVYVRFLADAPKNRRPVYMRWRIVFVAAIWIQYWLTTMVTILVGADLRSLKRG